MARHCPLDQGLCQQSRAFSLEKPGTSPTSLSHCSFLRTRSEVCQTSLRRLRPVSDQSETSQTKQTAVSSPAMKRFFLGCSVLFLLTSVMSAQRAPRVFTDADYARAETFMTYNVTPLVLHSGVRASWQPDGQFWYRTTTENGPEFYLVDPATGSKTRCTLPVCTERNADAAGGRGGGRGNRRDAPSPDGRKTGFIRDWNLWVRDVATGKETALTTDGVKDYGYATDNAGWTRSDRPIVSWSPDSKKVATFQQDQRKSGEMYLVDTKVGHPNLQAWKYPLPGDDDVTLIERVVIDVEKGTTVRFKMPPDQHRSTLCDDVACGQSWDDVQWAADGSTVAFVSTARDHRREQLRIADASTGAIRDVLEEKAETFYESGNGRVNWKYLPKSNEAIWFSERDNWGHLYLHDAQNGREKLQITHGEGNVTQLVAAGWKPPQPITVKARDGSTDLYGLLYKPTHLDPSQKYPIVNHIYPGPQTGSVGGRSFNPARGDAQALAELGFVVVEIDGMGTPWRSKKFHEAYYGNMGDNTLPDQVAGMKALAKRYPWIDIDRAAIYGHSGGGYATADAMFRYPDFFKVGISEAGNHDNRA